jgi:PadR family transcriptional regulator, regulatory protein PadR
MISNSFCENCSWKIVTTQDKNNNIQIQKQVTMDDLTGFQRDLLYVIAGADQPSGQDIKNEITSYYTSDINHGRLYPNLDTLVNKELVEKGELDRRTNYYVPSNEGNEVIRRRREWESQYVDL